MYTTTSKQEECSTCKDSHPKYFITTNSTAKRWRGVMNRGKVLRACLHIVQIDIQQKYLYKTQILRYR